MSFPHPINPILPLLKEKELSSLFDGGETTSLFKAPEAFVSIFYRPTGYQLTIDFFLQTHNQCFGITQSGKTESIAKLCEELLIKKVKLCILDSSKADFVSLKDLPQAKVKVLIVGGDPAKIAKDFMDGEYTYVFDRRGVRQSDFVPFFRVFFETLLELSVLEKRHVDSENARSIQNGKGFVAFITPVKIIIDEAQDYIPSSIVTITDKELRHEIQLFILSIENFARQARSYGKTLLLISQRPTDIITDIRSQTDGWFLFRQTSQNDLEFYSKLLPSRNWKDRNMQLAAIQKFKPGQCFFVSFGNGMLATFKRRKTSHASVSVSYANIPKWSSLEG